MTPQDQKPQQFMTVKMAAELLSLSTKSVRRLISEGELPVCRLGRSVRIAQSDFDRFWKTRRSG